MRAMVEVRWGKASGKKAVLEPGTTLRIGRVDWRSNFVIEHDRQMSGIHCEVIWDGTCAVLRDKHSRLGTFLNGERVTEAPLANGDWIKAADTNLMVYFEDHTPPRREADTAMTEVKENALAALEAESDPLFAVLDASRHFRVLELLRESVEEYRSLYEGVKGEAMAEAAPHLVRLPKGARLLRKLVAEGWGKRWGIYLTSKRPFREVRTHLRRYVMVKDYETEKRIYFRFYDPGAFRVVWPTSTVRQKGYLFADMGAVLFEDQDGAVTRVVGESWGQEGTWRIRKEQMEAIGKAMGLEEFRERMIPHLRTFWSQRAELMGVEGMRQVVHLAIERAREHQLDNPGPLRLFLELMLLYGSFFDTDPFLPWAGETLLDASVTDPKARVARLHLAMSSYYDEVSGPDEEFDRQALQHVDEVFIGGGPPNETDFEITLAEAFFKIHPRRAAYLGQERLRALVRAAATVAHQLAVDTHDGVRLVAFLMFVKGHRFADDPALPWVRIALSGARDDVAARVKRLEESFLAYREKLCAPLG